MSTVRPAHHAARYHLAGVTDRGPVGAAPRITSMAVFENYYGPRTEASAAVYDDVALFFSEGGWEAHVARVVGPAATRGTLTVTDALGDPTLAVEHTEPGAHSGELSLLVEHPGDGTYDVWLVRGTTRVEHWPDLITPSDFVSATDGHRLLSVTNLGTGTAPGPGTYTMSAGDDDAENITVADYRAALDATGGVARGGCTATPGLTIAQSGAELIAHAQAYQKVALLHGSQDQDLDSLAADAAALTGTPGADHAAVFWPWVSLPGDPHPRHQAPSGYVAASRARTCTTVGYWYQSAGDRSTARTIRALRFPNTPARNEEVSEQLVCPLVTARQGVQIHGWWSLSRDRSNFPHLLVRDILNNVAVDLAAGYYRAVNHQWDTLAKLAVHANAVTKAVLGRLAYNQALAPRYYEDGSMQDPGYTFRVSQPALQPPDRNVLNVHVAVRPERLPNLIEVAVYRVDVKDPLIQEAQG